MSWDRCKDGQLRSYWSVNEWVNSSPIYSLTNPLNQWINQSIYQSSLIYQSIKDVSPFSRKTVVFRCQLAMFTVKDRFSRLVIGLVTNSCSGRRVEWLRCVVAVLRHLWNQRNQDKTTSVQPAKSQRLWKAVLWCRGRDEYRVSRTTAVLWSVLLVCSPSFSWSLCPLEEVYLCRFTSSERIGWLIDLEHSRTKRSFGVNSGMLVTFYNAVTCSIIVYGTVCWGGKISNFDRGRLEKTVKKQVMLWECHWTVLTHTMKNDCLKN